MDWTGISALFIAVMTAVGLLYEKWRFQKRADQAASSAASAAESLADMEHDRDAIDQWKGFVTTREKQHTADLVRLEKQLTQQQEQLNSLLIKERDCMIRAAQQEVEMKHLRTEIDNLREALRRVGVVPPDTGTHKLI